MKIETDDPEFSGRYACYLHGVGVPTVIRFWCVGRGWLTHLQEPIAGSVAGWVGPLPVWQENATQPAPPNNLDFDL